MESLVNLRAVDIARILGQRGSFQIGSYNKAICTVIPVIKDCYDLIDLFYNVSKRLQCDNYVIVKRPKSEADLAKVYRDLEKELKNETENN